MPSVPHPRRYLGQPQLAGDGGVSLGVASSRTRTGPLAVDGSTRRPAWRTSTSPRIAIRRTARRTDSRCSAADTPLASVSAASSSAGSTSPRWLVSRSLMDCSRARSSGRTRRRRHADEHQRTSSQLRAHARRHVITRPQLAQWRGSGWSETARPPWAGALQTTIEMPDPTAGYGSDIHDR
jgi:hypothetical protein